MGVRVAYSVGLGFVVMVLAACGGSDRSVVSPRPIGFEGELQRILDQAVIRTNGAGVTAAVVAEGYEPWTGAAGYSVKSGSPMIPMTPDMLLEIGSVGKTFVTALLMQLVDEGVVSLDDPLSKWVSGYPRLDPRITLRQLVASTSGIPEWVDHPSSPFKRGVEKSRAWLARSWTVDDMLTKLVGKGSFPPVRSGAIRRPGSGSPAKCSRFRPGSRSLS